MNERCPTCKRRFKDEDDQCRRCGTELQQIKDVLHCFDSSLSAGRFLLRSDALQAEFYLRRSLSIKPQSIEVKKALALALLLQKRFAEAVLYSRV